ncbi:DUF4124 domain-containing protein [Teredinibacter franksiae]|uniref:DUF4124 domain-containing protein n=1 Tax=Teredinibacter franksiae TaxID=2761453 RepID=UPI001C89C924|nr:DUF4124 domain-containing protein [Teredinibacter franksiae]
MGKLVIKVVVMMGLMLGISNYMFYIMTGKSPFFDGSTSLSAPSLSDFTPSLPVGKDTAYKWTDEKGVVHYSSEPPPDVTQQVKKLEVDPNTNLVQGLEAKPVVPEANEQPVANTAPMVPGGAQQLLKDAKNVQKLLDDRYEQQKKAMGD